MELLFCEFKLLYGLDIVESGFPETISIPFRRRCLSVRYSHLMQVFR